MWLWSIGTVLHVDGTPFHFASIWRQDGVVYVGMEEGVRFPLERVEEAPRSTPAS